MREEKMVQGMNEIDQDMDDDDQQKDKENNKSIQQYFIIHPQKSSFKYLWDQVIYIGLGINFFLMPLTISFDAYYPPEWS